MACSRVPARLLVPRHTRHCPLRTSHIRSLPFRIHTHTHTLVILSCRSLLTTILTRFPSTYASLPSIPAYQPTHPIQSHPSPPPDVQFKRSPLRIHCIDTSIHEFILHLLSFSPYLSLHLSQVVSSPNSVSVLLVRASVVNLHSPSLLARTFPLVLLLFFVSLVLMMHDA